jgi:hypothetical protein
MVEYRNAPKRVHEHAGTGINARVAILITRVVGTMWCAYVFGVLAFVALPSAVQQHSPTVLVNWVSSNFLQLILLPIIIVGQNIQAKAADERAVLTYQDTELLVKLIRQNTQLTERIETLTKEVHAMTCVPKEG